MAGAIRLHRCQTPADCRRRTTRGVVPHVVIGALHRSSRGRRPCSMADGVVEKHSSMDELLAVLARTADGVFALDQAERVVFWNAAAERITGYRADEVLGRPCYEIFGSEQRAGCHQCQADFPVLRAARSQEPVPAYNVLGRTKAGASILLNISVIVPLACPGSVCTIHLFRDATRQLRYETYVEQILGAAAQLFSPQQPLVQRALQ